MGVRALVVAMLVLGASAAHAQDADETRHSYRTVIDRVDLEPAAVTGLRLRVYLSAQTLGGQQLDLASDAKSIKLYLGSSELKAPFALGAYAGTPSETAVVVLVQATLDYQDALPQIADALDRDLLGALPDSTQMIVLPYGEAVSVGKLSTAKALRGKLQLATDSSVGDPALLDTLDRALMLLKRAKTTPEGRPLRKIVVVIGDGRDMAADRDRVTRTGLRAAKEGVRIHTIAFSASDIRRPMLALGELSKQSLGTFRWVRKAAPDSWKAALEQLHDEIARQYVLTYFVGAEDEVAGKKLKVVLVGRTETTTINESKVPSPTCGGNDCTTGHCANDMCLQYKADGGRGLVGWLLLVGGILVGAVVTLGVIGFFITKAQQHAHRAVHPGIHPGMSPGMQPQMALPAPKPKKQKKQKGAAAAPGFLPNGRPIPALLIMNGPRTGERHMLRNGFMIGKQPGCDLLIEDGFTSSQHAQIGMDPNGNCQLYDRGSTNGTYINGARVTEMALQHGANVRIGSTEMRFLTE